MAKIRINDEYFDFDRDHKPMAEMLELEKVLKTTYGEWESSLQSGSAHALAGLVWLVWKRDGRGVPFEDIVSGKAEVNLGTLAIEGDDPPDPTTSPGGKGASTTTGTSTPARSRKS